MIWNSESERGKAGSDPICTHMNGHLSRSESSQPTSRVPTISHLFQNVSKGLADRKQNDQRKVSQGRLAPRSPTVEKSKELTVEQKENFDPLQHVEATPMAQASGASISGKMALNSPQPGPAETELGRQLLKTAREGNPLPRTTVQDSGGTVSSHSQGQSSAGEPMGPKTGSKAELRPPVSRPPLTRGVSWDSSPEEPGPLLQKVLAKLPLAEEEKRFPGKAKPAKPPGLKDFQIQVQPVRMQKLTKLREVGSCPDAVCVCMPEPPELQAFALKLDPGTRQLLNPKLLDPEKPVSSVSHLHSTSFRCPLLLLMYRSPLKYSSHSSGEVSHMGFLS